MPMWESLPSWRRVSLPVDVDAVGADPVVLAVPGWPGMALGRAWQGSGTG